MKTYYLVDTRTGKAGLKSEDRSFLEGMVKAMQYPNWIVTDTIPDTDDLAELTPHYDRSLGREQGDLA